MKKVLIITYYWPPSGGAGVQRVLKFAKYLPSFGYKPYVVTVDEHAASYPTIDHTFTKDIPPEAEVFRTKTFEPFNLYSKIIGKKSIPTGFSNESDPGLIQKFTRFVRGNFFIPDARVGWVNFAVKEAGRLIAKEKIDTVLCTSPPHSVQLCGMKLKREFGVKWIADLRDPWTDIYYYNEFNHLPFAARADRKLERKVLEESDAVITVSSELKKLFLTKSDKINSDKIAVIPNGFDEDDFTGAEVPNGEDLIISYTGTLADSYAPEKFLRAFAKAVADCEGNGIILHFIGNPSEKVFSTAKQLGLEGSIKFTPTVSHEESVALLARSDALMLLIPNVKNDKGILTGKLFEYLASRKPIIALGPTDGDAAKIINECEAGKMFDRNDEDGIAEYITGLAKAKKSGNPVKAESDAYKKYSRRAQTEELVRILESI